MDAYEYLKRRGRVAEVELVDSLYDKAETVVVSCVIPGQLKMARKYVDLVRARILKVLDNDQTN